MFTDALASIAHGMIMVKSVDGSFVPWTGLLARAPGDPVPVPLKNNGDLAYLVSLIHFLRVQVADLGRLRF
jgi:hypothetical protein